MKATREEFYNIQASLGARPERYYNTIGAGSLTHVSPPSSSPSGGSGGVIIKSGNGTQYTQFSSGKYIAPTTTTNPKTNQVIPPVTPPVTPCGTGVPYAYDQNGNLICGAANIAYNAAQQAASAGGSGAGSGATSSSPCGNDANGNPIAQTGTDANGNPICAQGAASSLFTGQNIAIGIGAIAVLYLIFRKK